MMHRHITATLPSLPIRPLPLWVDPLFTPRQLAVFEALLLAERDALFQSAQETTSHLQEFVQTADPSDRASLEEGQSLELRVRDRECQHLHAIDRALERIHDGSYGLCEKSGEPIGFARLMARPTATLSLEEQEMLELTPTRRPAHGHA
ncbi:TraR/DksA C4-type zinc finger protein [Thiomonas sp.]|jgi:DnaK suppressor protein|uniref:TraR/DksA C4-type zinc finger protein n=1 Tax=Thiomonas sp. TaxID=2047785 RepID=UPI002590A17C|nr:TraR/DksA C4-type zinc finger protein [Thiomonas sp.]